MSKKTEIIEKWSDKIRKSVLEVLIEGDNTPTTKYLSYMCNMWYVTRNLRVNKPKSSSELVKYVRLFDELLPYIKNKDVYSPHYQVWSNLKTVVDESMEEKLQKEFKREDHLDVLLENDDIILVRPKTHRGSLKYGANTRWCTASKGNHSTFTNYVRNGVLVYLNRKKIRGNKWDKVAFYIRLQGQGPLMNSVEVYCAQDTGHSSISLLKSDWSVSELLGIQNLVRSIAIKEWRLSQSTKNLKEFVQKVSSLDIEKALEELKIVKEGVPKEYEDLVSKFKKTVEKFTEKITLLE
jgi:hypothetical protein